MKEKQKGYMLLADGSAHHESEGPLKGLFVRGYIGDDYFFPEGDIEGEGPLGTSGYPGWMELFGAHGTFYGMQTGRPPFPPYVEGYMSDDGFRPSSRQIVY